MAADGVKPQDGTTKEPVSYTHLGDFNIAMAISVVLLAIAAILIVIHQIVMRKEE